LVLGTRRKWPRPRRDRDVDNFSRDETETRRWYVSRPSRDRDVETETTALAHNEVVIICTGCSATDVLLTFAAQAYLTFRSYF